MAETLLLRKGLYANLNSASCPIIPGAISITTDEPGIYLDLAEYDAQGNVRDDTKKRVRVGDFITFDSLEALYSEASKTYPVGSTPVYSEHALYYALKENVLCKYDKSTNSFIWINNLTPVYDKIDTLTADRIVPIEQAITDIQNTLTTINNTIGTRTTGHKATHVVDAGGNVTTTTKTVFKSIEDEYDRAVAAEAVLAEEIAAIKGGDGDSLAKLRADLTQESNDRASADVELQKNITANAKGIAQNAEDIKALSDTAAEHAGYISGIQSTIGTTTDKTGDSVYAKIYQEQEARKAADTTLSNQISNAVSEAQADRNKVRNEFARADQDLKDYLENYINDNLAVADAMTFKGGVGFKTGTAILDLPTTGVNKGDTWVITSDGDAGVGHTYHAGDLMIANQDQAITLQIKNEYIGEESLDDVLDIPAYRIAAGKTINTYYVEMLDWQHAYTHPKNETTEFSIMGCGYDIDRFGDTIPVLYPASKHPQGKIPWDMDYDTQYFYVGTEKVNDIIYDKWRCVEYGRWNEGIKYIYTDVVVTSVEGTVYPQSAWTHVATGYNEAHEPTLDLETALGNPNIVFNSHTGKALGNISFKSNSANLAVSLGTNGSYECVTFGLQWASF